MILMPCFILFSSIEKGIILHLGYITNLLYEKGPGQQEKYTEENSRNRE
jgi:hypothetical protein